MQLIVFRGFQSVTISFCLTTAVGIISTSFPANQGQIRNITFAVLGAGSPVGHTIGLILGGVFVGTAGWRVAFYLAAGLNAILFDAAVWGPPHDGRSPSSEVIWSRLRREIDWIGAVNATPSLAMLSYVMA
jgi:MFS family permease